jgi:NADPH-dependent 2,4-dienoyl-CoA reductase/sulfur reductase-like enzyme
LGKEGFFDFRPTEAKKRVCVIGGGPAGLEVARVAALRGHDVTLYEKKALGGRLIEASAPDFKASLRRLIDYLRTQLEETGVRQVNEEFTPAVLQDADYDTVIIATGGLERLLEVPGADGESILSYLEVLKGAETGEKVVVIGGGLGGCDVAQMLAAQGKKVAVVDILEEIGAHMNQAEKNVVFGKFEEYAVELHPGRLISEILDDGVQLQDRFGRKEVIESDTVVAAIGFTPNLSLFEELAGNRELEVFAIGDCVQARKVFDAIHEGWWVGFQI